METSSSRVVSLHDRENAHVANGHAFTLPPAGSILSDEAKIQLVSHHFAEIMKAIGLDLNEDGLRDTPRRIARMYVKEIFKGLNPAYEPSVSLLKNKNVQNKLVIEKNITLHSFCEHHFLPIIGKVHIGYISNGSVLRVSTLNRIVQYHAKRPQLQDRLTDEIAGSVKDALKNQDVVVLIDAVHLCVTMRGVKDANISTITSYFGGKFQNEDVKSEFLLTIK